MKTVEMNKFGSVLTGREFGKDMMIRLAETIEYPVVLNFNGVISLGSSFADEVLIPIAKQQGNVLEIINASTAVWDCINDVAIDAKIEIIRL